MVKKIDKFDIPPYSGPRRLMREINRIVTTMTEDGVRPAGSAGGDLSGDYPTPTIGEGKVTDAKLAANAVTAEKIASDAVTEAKIKDGAVTDTKIADGAVKEAKIANGAVTKGKIADGAVETEKIKDDAVTADKIADGVIPTTLPPNGAASGDLSENYPNPTIGKGKVTLEKLASDVKAKLVTPQAEPQFEEPAEDASKVQENLKKLVEALKTAGVLTAGDV